MATRYEVVLGDDETFFFQLRTADGDVILRSLGSPSKIMTQNEILHLRNSLRDESRLVPHESADGSRFLVIKDSDGSVLARSAKVGSDDELESMAAQLQAAASAPMVDLAKVDRTRAG